MKSKISYKDSGVNINEGNKFVKKIQPYVKKTLTSQVIGNTTSFAALFSLKKERMKDPILVACTDGVGTKIEVGIKTNKIRGLGTDLVAMSINDLIQEGNLNLVKAIKRIDWTRVTGTQEAKEKTLKSFLSKRIKGGIRRAIDINRGDMRIPEHKLNEIRKNNGKDHKMVSMFFNSMFLSIDEKPKDDEENMIYQIADKSEPYNIGLLNVYLTSLLRTHLNDKEYNVLRLSYGLDCDKHSANQIASLLNIEGSSAYVRVSELKKQAVDKLIDSVDHSQVLDYL